MNNFITLKANATNEKKVIIFQIGRELEKWEQGYCFYDLMTEDLSERNVKIPITKGVKIEIAIEISMAMTLVNDMPNSEPEPKPKSSHFQESISIFLPRVFSENLIRIFNGDIPLKKLDSFLFVSTMFCDYSKSDPTDSDILMKDQPSKDNSDLELFHPVRFFNDENELHQAIYIGHDFFIDKLSHLPSFTLRTREQIVKQYDAETVFGCETKKRCDNCMKSGPDLIVYRCSSCQVFKYCGKECQKKAWPTHKILCKTFKSNFLKLL